MTSLQTSVRQVSPNTGYFIPVGDCRTTVYSIVNGAVAAPTWATAPGTGAGYYSSLIKVAGGGLLKDMGKTVVSSSHTFRKVQLVVPNTTSTFGVGGPVGSVAPQADWLNVYIELGFGADGLSSPTPVACFGR